VYKVIVSLLNSIPAVQNLCVNMHIICIRNMLTEGHVVVYLVIVVILHVARRQLMTQRHNPVKIVRSSCAS